MSLQTIDATILAKPADIPPHPSGPWASRVTMWGKEPPMQHVRRCVAPLVLALAAALAASACGDGAVNRDSGVISIGIAEPKFLIPSSTTETEGHEVLSALFAPLVEYDAQFRPYEVAAASITTTDNRVWTIALQPGWTFHNGEPVTADSYMNAWNAGAYGPNAHDGNYFYDKIEGYADLNPIDASQPPAAKKLSGVTKRDDLTFEVALGAPYVNFKSMLGYTAFLPLPLAAFEDVDNNVLAASYNESPIGQGPFKMKGVWRHDQVIETERFEDFQGPKVPSITGVQFRIYQQLTTMYQDMLAGQLDVVRRVPAEYIASAAADLGDRFIQSPASTVQFLSFPTFDEKYSNPAIRRAISMAIDREEIVQTIFQGSQKALRAFVSPIVPGYRENTCGEACEFRPEEARALFDQAGGAAAVNDLIEIAYNVDGAHKTWVDATCNQIRAHLGVNCVGNPQPKFAELLTKLRARQPVGAYRMGWVFDYPAMENYLGPLFTTGGSSNYTGYSNPEFDRLLAAGDRAETPEEATRYYQQAEDLLARDLPALPLRVEQNNSAHSTHVTNVEIDLFNRVVLDTIQIVEP
jgi:peptide/nickel transport system substrate-binding protein/oligopeptide transport system substrate-binding protein